MLRKLASSLSVTLALVGCSVGGGDGDDDMMMMPPNPNPDASVPVTSVCTAQLTVTGTFTAASPPLDPAGGCQPQGQWTVTATVSDQGTCSNVPLKESYSYILTGAGRDTTIAYAKDTSEEFQGAVAASGSGGCAGSFEHILPDGSNFGQVLLKPFLPKVPGPDLTELEITGQGTFDLWAQHP
jgi:hypothetical protein